MEEALCILKEEITDPQMASLLVEAMLSKIHKDFAAQDNSERTIGLLEKGYTVLREKGGANEYGGKVVRELMEPVMDELSEL